ncbi:MAG: type IV pilus twitching motility protein PilT [Verrucomicrobiae bacterium]|nr:type IV pilus twitching motility protein PilT [Verrucomicrobiae bacterium]
MSDDKRLHIQLAAQQGWLTEDQVHDCLNCLEEDPSVDILQLLVDQGLFTSEHVDWLHHHVPAESAPGSAEGIPEEAEELPAAQTPESPPEVASTETPVAAREGQLENLTAYLSMAKDLGASDLHLGVASPPMIRLHGMLRPLWENAPLLEPDFTRRILLEVLTPEQRVKFDENHDIDFSYDIPGLGRFRSSVVQQRLGIDGVFRIINPKVRTMEELSLPPILKSLTKFHNGLVLVTGPSGSGKSTTLAALVEEVNKVRTDHIITLEDPIEYVFEPKGCHISQREVRTHTESFAAALRGALREDPDIIMVGEMRDLETISLAITAAETGHLVFGTLNTSSAARTLDRVLDAFPVEQQAQIRIMVSTSLRGIISQQLVPRKDGQGRVLAMEILINTTAVESLIREAKTYMLQGVMQTGKKVGSRLMDDSLMELLVDEKISAREAYDRADQKNLFKEYLTE